MTKRFLDHVDLSGNLQLTDFPLVEAAPDGMTVGELRQLLVHYYLSPDPRLAAITFQRSPDPTTHDSRCALRPRDVAEDARRIGDGMVDCMSGRPRSSVDFTRHHSSRAAFSAAPRSFAVVRHLVQAVLGSLPDVGPSHVPPPVSDPSTADASSATSKPSGRTERQTESVAA